MNVAIIAPHPDDEVLGAGGTMARLAREGAHVHVVVVTTAYPPVGDEQSVAAGRREMREAHDILGVKSAVFLDFPAAAQDRWCNSHLLSLPLAILSFIFRKEEVVNGRIDGTQPSMLVAQGGVKPFPGSTPLSQPASSKKTMNHWTPTGYVSRSSTPAPRMSYASDLTEALVRKARPTRVPLFRETHTLRYM